MAYLDHIGIGVKDNSPLTQLLEILGLPTGGNEEVASEGVHVTWIPLPKSDTRIELLETASPDTALGKFMEKQKKDVIHHLCFRVENIIESSKELRAAGFQFVL